MSEEKYECPLCFSKHSLEPVNKHPEGIIPSYVLCNEHYKEGKIALIPVTEAEDGTMDGCPEFKDILYIADILFSAMFNETEGQPFVDRFAFVSPEAVTSLLERIKQAEKNNENKEKEAQPTIH